MLLHASAENDSAVVAILDGGKSSGGGPQSADATFGQSGAWKRNSEIFPESSILGQLPRLLEGDSSLLLEKWCLLAAISEVVVVNVLTGQRGFLKSKRSTRSVHSSESKPAGLQHLTAPVLLPWQGGAWQSGNGRRTRA